MTGIRDETLSEKLQLDPELTLEKAKKIIRQREAVYEQVQTLKEEPDRDLGAIRTGTGNPGNSRRPKPKWCIRCGSRPHPWDKRGFVSPISQKGLE